MLAGPDIKVPGIPFLHGQAAFMQNRMLKLVAQPQQPAVRYANQLVVGEFRKKLLGRKAGNFNLNQKNLNGNED